MNLRFVFDEQYSAHADVYKFINNTYGQKIPLIIKNVSNLWASGRDLEAPKQIQYGKITIDNLLWVFFFVKTAFLCVPVLEWFLYSFIAKLASLFHAYWIIDANK